MINIQMQTHTHTLMTFSLLSWMFQCFISVNLLSLYWTAVYMHLVRKFIQCFTQLFTLSVTTATCSKFCQFEPGLLLTLHSIAFSNTVSLLTNTMLINTKILFSSLFELQTHLTVLLSLVCTSCLHKYSSNYKRIGQLTRERASPNVTRLVLIHFMCPSWTSCGMIHVTFVVHQNQSSLNIAVLLAETPMQEMRAACLVFRKLYEHLPLAPLPLKHALQYGLLLDPSISLIVKKFQNCQCFKHFSKQIYFCVLLLQKKESKCWQVNNFSITFKTFI